MASIDQKVFTYHVVPRFDISAKNGPLYLGAIHYDLEKLVPLNRKFVIEPRDLVYEPVIQTEFKNSLAKVRKLNSGAWIEALGLPVGASAEVGGTSDIEDSVSCDSIITTYFDPDPAGEYTQKCFEVKPVRDKLAAAKEQRLDGLRIHATDLYLVTGLKVAKNLKFNKSGSSERHISGSGEGSEPHTNAFEGGLSADVSDEKKHSLEFTVDDIVIGYRVNHYRVKRMFGTDRKMKDKGVLDGDMQDDQDSQSGQPCIDVEAIPEEATSHDFKEMDGSLESWIS